MGRKFVVWSGGLDSTCLLHKLAKEHHDVIAIIFESNILNSYKQWNERAARDEFEKRLEKETGVQLKKVLVQTQCSGHGHDVMNGQYGWPQALLWLSTALTYVRSGDELYFGYVKGDCFWEMFQTVQDYFQATCKILGITDVQLKYPFEHTKKSELIAYANGNNFYDVVWYCENPMQADSCGRCNPCLTHKEAYEEYSPTPKLMERLSDEQEMKMEKLANAAPRGEVINAFSVQ